MTAQQSIDVQATAHRVYALAQDIAAWPSRLPHYRYVTVLEQTERARVAIMAARRDWIPVRWTAQERLLPEVPRIEFTHLSGWARGMEVAWTFDEIPGGTRVTILHDLDGLRLPLVRSPWGRDIMSSMFIQPIARRTLARMKSLAEETP